MVVKIHHAGSGTISLGSGLTADTEDTEVRVALVIPHCLDSMQVGFDIVGELLNGPVAESHVHATRVWAPESGVCKLLVVRAVCVLRGLEVYRLRAAHGPKLMLRAVRSALVIPFKANVHRLIVSVLSDVTTVSGYVIVSLRGNKLLTDDVGLAQAINDLRNLDLAAETDHAVLVVWVGGRCASGNERSRGANPVESAPFGQRVRGWERRCTCKSTGCRRVRRPGVASIISLGGLLTVDKSELARRSRVDPDGDRPSARAIEGADWRR